MALSDQRPVTSHRRRARRMGDAPRIAAATFALALPLIVPVASASDLFSGPGSATTMWGTSSGAGLALGLGSAELHYKFGLVAGNVNAARDGFLYGDGSILSITAIGSSNSVSNTIINSDDISIDVDADQSASNSGDVRADGTFNVQNNDNVTNNNAAP